MSHAVVLLGLAAATAGMAACGPPHGATGSGGAGGATGTGGQMSIGGHTFSGRDGLPATSTACMNGPVDAIARALCRPAREVTGLADLYRVLGLETRWDQRLNATTTHSLGLAGRLVSAINPRVVVFTAFGGNEQLKPDKMAALAFTRGEQAVELVGYDPVARDLNFYLVVFEQACNRGHCTPAELFSPAVEANWTGWTLYADRDLEDTTFDCLSCHRPDGPASPKRFLMRQLDNPWAHWAGFVPFSPDELCPFNLSDPPVPGPLPSTRIEADNLRLLQQVDPGGSYARLPFDELSQAASGHDLQSLIIVANQTIDGTVVRGEPMPYPSLRILCEGSVGLTDAWRGYRVGMLARGFPTPYHRLDVLDADRRVEALAGFPAYLARRPAADPFAIGAELMSDEAEEAIGFIPSGTDDAPAMLRQMCVRCHDDTTPSSLRRSRFNAARLDGLTAEGAAAVWKRLIAPRSSPDLMPPLRSGELPPWALDKLRAFLRVP